MKRFYKDVTVTMADSGFAVQLDARPVRTPARLLLALPTSALAQAVAEEWREQGETLDPRTMPMTGLANAAIDQIAVKRGDFAAGIAQYGASDLLCYRAEGPAPLVSRQAAAWDPLLDWARTRYGAELVVTQGIIPILQPADTLDRLATAVAAHDPFALAGLSTLVNLSGSLVCGLAVAERAFDPETIWDAAEIDEAWQAEQWGEDAEAIARAMLRRTDFLTAAAFTAMARD